MQIPFPTQSSPGFDGTGPRIINGYTEYLGNKTVITASSGLKSFATLSGKCRMLRELDGTLYAVMGTELHAISYDGSFQVIGTIAGEKPIRHSANDKTNPQIALSAEDGNYIIESFNLTRIADTDLPPSVDSLFIDGYTIFPISDGRFFWTTLSESSEVDALDFATAEKHPDGNVGGDVVGRYIWLLGTDSSEIWQNVGGVDLPFQRIASHELGCSFKHSIQSIRQSLLWVGDGVVYRANGLTPEIISTPSVNEAIRTAQSDITATIRLERGHAFYTIRCDEWAWECDLNTGRWFERKSYGSNTWQVLQVAKFGNKLLGGADGVIYELDFDTYKEGTDPLIMELVSDEISGNGNRQLHKSMNIDLQRGAATKANDTPYLMLDWSSDGGRTFENERQLSIGKIGERNIRVRTHRLGSDYRRNYRIRISADTAKQFYGAELV